MTALAESTTTEGRIFNDIVELLDRQRREPVTGPLNELRLQLADIYASKNKDVATCQMGLGLAHFGLGDREEALRMIDNALKNDSHSSYIVNNALLVFLNCGEFHRAHQMAKSVSARFSGEPSTLKQVINVFAEALDFDAAAESIAQYMHIHKNDVDGGQLANCRQLFLDLAERAVALGYSYEDLLAITQHSADSLRSHGRNIYWVHFRGSRPSSVALEVYVDASPEECSELQYDVAEGLFEKFGARAAADLVPISVRSYIGRPNADKGVLTA